ncbi:2-oxoglutarate dehydrogenase E1 component [Aequorivita viscosa]|uniref:oxoglutarate dehydrogenase (succinyl-transferring) n=1 Tax=Aequorivita viscosa TaxID=797419 RepID=A0A1M6C3B2_9FLAO|nr:2-oxoglutarate dehydrogenase E1 component [Aequorivita viscosa]SDW23101.1 2-oxoglutarate dehydrogenase E1 component [Aequorivita viscosa]SHI55443.1 2-oxoglutarate dehydrogenase E1 component [Aequorivita viscosa]
MDKFSFLNAVHPSYIAELYEKYLQYPDSIEPSWRAFFQGYDFGSEAGSQEFFAPTESSTQPQEYDLGAICSDVIKEFQVIRLIDGYRTRGHFFTKTNPVRERRQYSPTLALENFGLTQDDLKAKFRAGEIIGLGETTLEEIIRHLEKIYCDSIGIEYMFIRNPEEIEWIQTKLNANDNQPDFSSQQKKHILKKLNEAVSFETFLHTKYVGQKRFSLEGGESLIPALDSLIENAAEKGVEEFVMGMAHRGRLSTLTNIFGKSAKDIFSEFDGKDYALDIFDGDVKYHLGWTSKRKTDSGKEINLNIAPNPSHLETVGAVVQGITRAKQDDHHKEEPSKVLPIIVHGDAAIAGQGLVYEIVQMAQLDGYKTGGTIHIVVNNQIGFTTNYLDARSSIYCTDVGKVTFSPILHVNADDVEAVVHAMLFALDFRMTFGRDVFIDLLGYRKYGHNEGDEPRFTQPKLYKAIARHSNPRDIYSKKLVAQGVIDENYTKQLEEEYKAKLEENLEDSRKEDKTTVTPFMQDEWEGYEYVKTETMMETVDTKIDLNKLDEIAEVITKLPKEKKFLSKINRLIEARHTMYFKDNKLDWAMGELLAYGSLLKEGHDVRMSGQDVERGTFSHRHAVIKVEDSEEEVVLLNELKGDQGDFYIYNSLLSEYGVVGFDYGYAMASPNTLTIWEAQFGDFSNGAQIMIDQYISAAEDKWKLQNGLVMLLPHGYEGQGAEHSSARMERYLQLCATDNMFVANVTTPANLFHILRRQLKTNYRKPLIIFTPKSLLRHPKVVSTKEEMANGSFQMVIDDPKAKASKIKTLVFVSGKFYYDLIEKREELKRDDVAFIRLEQLFPLPKDEIRKMLKKYKNADDVVWAQEEPKNMGAYSYLLMHLEEAKDFRICSRKMYAAPAAGSTVRSKARHAKVIENVFDKSMD